MGQHSSSVRRHLERNESEVLSRCSCSGRLLSGSLQCEVSMLWCAVGIRCPARTPCEMHQQIWGKNLAKNTTYQKISGSGNDADTLPVEQLLLVCEIVYEYEGHVAGLARVCTEVFLFLVFQDAVHVYSGGLDCQLKMFDLNAGNSGTNGSTATLESFRLCCWKLATCFSADFNCSLIKRNAAEFESHSAWCFAAEMTVGQHDKPIKCVEFSHDTNTVVTGSWDSTVKLWDPRTPGSGASTFPQPEKVTYLRQPEF